MKNMQLIEVKSKSELKQFIRFQINLYEGCSYAAPPLAFDEYKTLDSKQNPAFDFCEAAYWLVKKDGKTVGRIAAIINNMEPDKNAGRIGFFDFIDDAAVVNLLIDTAFDWLKAKGKTKVHGPLGFTDLDRQGLLIMGFEEVGTLVTAYNYEYYVEHFNRLGFEKSTDWIEYHIDGRKPLSEKIIRVADYVQKRYGVKPIPITNKKQLRKYVPAVFDLINAEYKNLYGYSALTERQVQFYADNYFGFLRYELISLVEDAEGNLIGVSITLPSFTKALQKAKGTLLPFGWYHLLRALKKNDTMDFCLIAIDSKWQSRGVTTLMIREISNGAKKLGIDYAESSIMLEDNDKVLSMWKSFEKRQHKRRRCYIKDL